MTMKTTATTSAKQNVTKKPASRSTAKKKAVELGDCITLPSFANNSFTSSVMITSPLYFQF